MGVARKAQREVFNPVRDLETGLSKWRGLARRNGLGGKGALSVMQKEVCFKGGSVERIED
jgi:hypothetical protein